MKRQRKTDHRAKARKGGKGAKAKSAKASPLEDMDIQVGYAESDEAAETRGILSRVRFLPLVIFIAALMLPLKLNNVWEGIGDVFNRSQSVAQAQEGDVPPPGAEDAMPAPNAAMPAGEDGGGEPAPADDAVTASLLSEDPTLLTQAEIELLQQLAERREALDGRSRELEVRQGMLEAAETRIDKKITEFKGLQATIEGLLKKYDDQQDGKMQSLVKIYENMKPKDAARIFEELDMDTLLLVAERMKERKLAPVMAKMNPEKAREVTVELSRLRDIPKSGENSGG